MTGEAPRRGVFVTLEGPDGSGKTAQAERLRAAVEAAGREAVLVREPGGTPAGERIRAILMDRGATGVGLTQRTDALLFLAARSQLVETVIEPALERGAVVISDRYLDSTLAYQGYGGGLDVAAVREVGRWATGGLQPDLTLLFDVPVEVGLARKSAAETTRFEAHFDHAFHERVRAGYLAMAAAEPGRWVVLDASAPEADVLAAALQALGGHLGLALGPAQPQGQPAQP
jgi:dTMP kinase